MPVLLTLASYGLAMALLARWGNRWDRAAVGLFVVTMVLDPFVGTIVIGTWRAGLAGSSTILLIGLWWIAVRANRWWIILACGAQLVATATHVVPFLTSTHLIWSGYATRQALYALIAVYLFIGAAEARRFRSTHPAGKRK